MQSVESLRPDRIGPTYRRWTQILRSFSQVLIRPMRTEDAAAERDFMKALTPQASRAWYLRQIRYPSQSFFDQFTDPAYVQDVAFVAVVPDGAGETFVGVARYSTTINDTECEFAVSVLDDWQNLGLATALMRHLIDLAKIRGIKRMRSVDSVENTAMGDMARELGFERRHHPDNLSQVIHTLRIGGNA